MLYTLLLLSVVYTFECEALTLLLLTLTLLYIRILDSVFYFHTNLFASKCIIVFRYYIIILYIVYLLCPYQKLYCLLAVRLPVQGTQHRFESPACTKHMCVA
jgi:hypothetical protein